MSPYRHHLPQLGNDPFVTDSGLETSLIFQEGIDLPHFASFVLLDDPARSDLLRAYFERHVGIARARNMGIVLETPTWRANRDWGARLGYDAAALARINTVAVAQLADVRRRCETAQSRVVISGNLGPRGDGYRSDCAMTAVAAQEYHAEQIRTFAATDADMVAAFTMNYTAEAVGIVQAARDAGMPVAISFTVETDGRLPSGTPLGEAIESTDEATDGYAAYFMINCAHPTHFMPVLERSAAWCTRLKGVRANASQRSHAELDTATELDSGDPHRLGTELSLLRRTLPSVNILGGCCGTDHRHIEAISVAYRSAA